MPTKLERTLEKFQGNAYPAMIDDLGDHLGVSSDSIRRLAVGWAPIVVFRSNKSGILKPSYQGWWVIPERDENARVTGLGLRAQDDYKVMYPGSKHGLIYEVNPSHSGGDHGYEPGAHNWVRTMDVGIICPVCSKPDGCLLSADEPADPKAVICIREKSDRPLRMGHLHIRKSEGNLSNASVLPPSEFPVLSVEGFSDTAAGMDLGLVGVGSPSNLACVDMLRDVFRGRAAIVLGENDKKEDGREPGREGMIARFQVLKEVCRDVRMVMPPANVKDLRAWVVAHGLKRDELLEYAIEKGEERLDSTIILNDLPDTIAQAYLDQCHRLNSRYTLRRWESTWYRYSGAKYTPVKEEAFIKPLYAWARGKSVQKENLRTGELSFNPLRMNTATVADVKQAVLAETLVEDRMQPCWINSMDGPDPKDLIVFNNGILDVPAFLAGTDSLLDSTPDLFTTAEVPIDFDPTARCPHWVDFLASSLGDDPTKIDLLQEWIGYCLTPDTSHQKMMYFRGPPASGKGTIIEVIRDIVGAEQAASLDFATISGDFGLHPLVGKLVCLIGDARTPKRGDAARGLEVLLNITGNDAVQVNRKHKDHLDSLQLTCRITIASNELLDVPDHAGAMIRRLNFIEFVRSFRDKPDIQLREKLRGETAGIVVWALEGLRRLRANGAFTVPASSREAMMEWKTATSPVAAFLEECCDQDDLNAEILKRELFDAWSEWSGERRIVPISQSRFYERLRSNAVGISSETYERAGHKMSIFRGIKLKPWAARKYLRKPN